MRFRARLSGDVVAWLRLNHELLDDFDAELGKVRSGINLGEPIKVPGERYLLRFFRFGPRGKYLAIFQLDASRTSLRVVKCASTDQPSV